MFLLLNPNAALSFFSLVLCLVILLFACLRAPWLALARVPMRQHAWFGAMCSLSVFWLLQVNVIGVLAFHPLALTTLTLVFGWHLACIAGMVALIVNALLLGRFGVSTPVELLLGVLIPILASQFFVIALDKFKVRNIFVFMLGGGFVGAMVSLLSMLVASGLLFFIFETNTHFEVLQSYGYILLLMLFPEGFINGAMISVLVVFYPQFVRAYDERLYLGS